MNPMALSAALLTIDDILSKPGFSSGELWDGHFVVRSPSGGAHAVVETTIAGLLSDQPGIHEAGWIFGSSGGFVVKRNPDRVLSPDVSFVSHARLPRLPSQGFVEGAPDVAIEIKSPRDTWESVVRKGGIWIGHGVDVVWCVDPEKRRLLVLRPGAEPEVRVGVERASLRPAFDAELEVDDIFRRLG